MSRFNVANTIGIVGTSLLVWDASSNGVRKGLIKARNEEGHHLADVFIKHDSAPVASTLLEKTKAWYREFTLDSGIFEQYSKIKNVILGVCSEHAQYAIPLGLGIGAMTLGPILGGICASGLVLMGIKAFLEHVVGIGGGSH